MNTKGVKTGLGERLNEVLDFIGGLSTSEAA
jgi:hypothetical protein